MISCVFKRKSREKLLKIRVKNNLYIMGKVL